MNKLNSRHVRPALQALRRELPMKNRRPFFILCVALFAAALVAFPGGAWAAGGPQTDSSHAKIEGLDEDVAYYDSLRLAVEDAVAGQTVTLIADDTNEYSKSVDVDQPITIDLNGKTLNGSAGAGTLQVTTNNIAVTIKNGTINSTSQRGVYINGYNTTVNLENVSVPSTSADFEAVCVQKGGLELADTTITNNATSALKIEDNGNVTVKSGTINGDVANNGRLVIEDGDFFGNVPTSSNLTVEGGRFASCSILKALNTASGQKYALQYTLADEEAGESAWYVVTDMSAEGAEADLKNASNWALSYVGVNVNYVYYEYGTSEDVVKADKNQLGDMAGYRRIYRVTFKDGDDVTYYGRCESETIGSLPAKSDTDEKFFLGWFNGDAKAEETTVVSEDVTYEAKWADAVAEFGGKKYQTLQEAIDAAAAGGTVTLLNDTAESVQIPAGSALTLDLGGKTLTTSKSGNQNAVKLVGTRELTIKNGTIKNTGSTGRCIYAVVSDDESSLGSVLTLAKDLTCESTASSAMYDAIVVEGSTASSAQPNTKLVIEGGSYSNKGNGAALSVEGAELSIADGTFTTNSNETMSISGTAVASLSCDISGYIGLDSDNNVTIQPGTTFGKDKNKNDIDTSKYHLLMNETLGKYLVSAHEPVWVIDKAPTSTEDGEKHQECKAEGCSWKSETEKIPAGTDYQAPVIEGLVAGASYDVSKTFTVTDDGAVTVYVNGSTILTPSADGVYTLSADTLPGVTGGALHIEAVDEAGNSSDVAIYWYKDHVWKDWSKVDDTHHAHTCSRCGEVETGDHSGGEANCVSRATCEVCHEEYGSVDATNHAGNISSEWSSDDSNHWHVCDACNGHVDEDEHQFEYDHDESNHWKQCKVCGYKTGETTHALEMKSDESGHWQECECGYKTASVDHTYGDWSSAGTDGHKHVCADCGYVQTVAHELVVKSDATGHWYECSVCGYKTSQEPHKYGNWECTDEGHKGTCEVCGSTHEDVHSLVWVTDKEATATEDGSQHEECEVCGYKTGETKVIPKTGDDSGDDKGDEVPDVKPDTKPNRALPATGDPAIAVSGVAAAGAALAGLGLFRRRK